MGRANLCALCKDLLGSARVTAPFVEPLMKVFCAVRSDVDERIQEVAEIISELRDPMQVSGTNKFQFEVISNLRGCSE